MRQSAEPAFDAQALVAQLEDADPVMREAAAYRLGRAGASAHAWAVTESVVALVATLKQLLSKFGGTENFVNFGT